MSRLQAICVQKAKCNARTPFYFVYGCVFVCLRLTETIPDNVCNPTCGQTIYQSIWFSPGMHKDNNLSFSHHWHHTHLHRHLHPQHQLPPQRHLLQANRAQGGWLTRDSKDQEAGLCWEKNKPKKSGTAISLAFKGQIKFYHKGLLNIFSIYRMNFQKKRLPFLHILFHRCRACWRFWEWMVGSGFIYGWQEIRSKLIDVATC